MDYHKITTLNEAKSYFKSLWRPMESECVLKNLKKILNFLQSPAEEVCFVNMQEKYLPFYYMIVLDEQFLLTTFLTDECKVVANEILQTLEDKRNSFTWEVCFSRQVAGIPVIFRKLYTQPCQPYPRERYERPIRSAFKETWIKTTLKFIKSSRLILKYPEMPRREAQYLYRGILKLNEDELGPDSSWADVWEALNIFKLRYEYIISLHPTAFDYLKFVHFEKVTLRRKHHGNKNKIDISQLVINVPKTVIDDNTTEGCKAPSNLGVDNSAKVSVINHNELIKTLLEMKVTNTGTIVYTLKLNEPNMATASVINEVQDVVNQSFDGDMVTGVSAVFEGEAVISETETQSTNLVVPVDVTADVSRCSSVIAIHGEVNMKNIEHIDLNVMPASGSDLEFLQKPTMLNEDPKINQNDSVTNEDITGSVKLKRYGNIKNDSIIVDNENTIEADNETVCLVNENVDEVSTSVGNKEKCDNIQSQLTESPSNVTNITSLDIATIVVDDDDVSVIEISDSEMDEGSDHSDESGSVSENPFMQQLEKLQKINSPVFVKEDDFMLAENINEPIDTKNDGATNKNTMKLIVSKYGSNNTDHIFHSLFKKVHLKKQLKTKSSKAQRRYETRIRQKCRLVSTVPTKFILTAFKAILDFIDDDLRASMEMVNLNLQEFNFLKKLHGLSPDVVPVEEIFDKACAVLASELFDHLKEKRNFSLEINWVKPGKTQKNISTDGKRHRALVFQKRPFKKNKNIVDSNTHNKHRDMEKDFEQLRYPKSILEKMLMSPLKTGISSGRCRMSPERIEGSRSSSVSPVRPKSSPAKRRLQQLRTKSLEVDEEFSDKPARTPTMKHKASAAVDMKAKLLEGLAAPLESDKAMRIMRLMGWNGGALGVRGEGLIEPIQPQLNVPKGVGLGHKMFKSKNNNIIKLQKKIKYLKAVPVQAKETVNVDKDRSENMPESNAIEIDDVIIIDNKNDDNIVTNEVIFDTQKTLNNSVNIELNKLKSLQMNVGSSDVNENQNVNPNETVSNWSNDGHALEMKPKIIETDPKGNIEGSGWLTNENFLQKVNNWSTQTASNSSNVETAKSNIATMANGEEKIKDKIGLDKHTLVQKNIETVRSNHEKLMQSLQKMNNETHGEFKVADDVKLHSYTRESGSRFLSDRTQFLVHLLDLLQSYEKIFTVVSYAKKPNQKCIMFIDSVIWSLNRRVEIGPTLPNEVRLIEACAREMEAHTLLLLSCRFNKKLLVLVKTDGPSSFNPLLTDVPYAEDIDFSTTHSISDYHLYSQIPQGIKPVMRNKIITNRIILDFVKSGDDVRVYDYQRTSVEIRLYVISLVSLLNRQMAQYQLGLGNSEDPVFRETLEVMKNFCLIFRFDTQNAFFHKLQLVKVDLTKKCRVCQLTNQLLNLSNQTRNQHDSNDDKADDSDIDLYPNRFRSSTNDAIHRENLTYDKSAASIYTSYDSDYTDEKAGEEYLIGEDWFDSDVNDEINTKTELRNKKYSKIDEDSENIIQNITLEEATHNERNDNEMDKEICSDFHNWPKRIRKDETNNNNISGENIEWPTAKRYKSESIPKRKINSLSQKTVKETIEDFTDAAHAMDIDNLHKTSKTNVNDDYIEESDKNTVHDAVTNVIEQNTVKLTTKVIESNIQMRPNVKMVTDEPNWPKTLLVVHYNHPNNEIDAISAMSLQSLIYEAVDKGEYLPRLKCYGFKDGGVVYTCYDFKSYIWLYDQLPWYRLTHYDKQLDSTYIIEMKINSLIQVDINIIFNNIEKCYGHIKTSSWKLIRTKVFPDCSVFTIEVNDNSLKYIKKEEYSLFVGIDKADISVIHK